MAFFIVTHNKDLLGNQDCKCCALWKLSVYPKAKDTWHKRVFYWTQQVSGWGPAHPLWKRHPCLEEAGSRVTQEQWSMQGFFRVMHASPGSQSGKFCLSWELALGSKQPPWTLILNVVDTMSGERICWYLDYTNKLGWLHARADCENK